MCNKYNSDFLVVESTLRHPLQPLVQGGLLLIPGYSNKLVYV